MTSFRKFARQAYPLIYSGISAVGLAVAYVAFIAIVLVTDWTRRA